MCAGTRQLPVLVLTITNLRLIFFTVPVVTIPVRELVNLTAAPVTRVKRILLVNWARAKVIASVIDRSWSVVKPPLIMAVLIWVIVRAVMNKFRLVTTENIV